jgi:hypothetical protein
VNLHLILGLPGDDLAGFGRSLDFAERAVRHLGADRVGGVRVFWLVVTPGSELWERRDELGIRIRERGVPYALATRGFDEPERASALRRLQDHAVAPWCVVDGPPELLECHVRPGFELVAGYLVPEQAPPAATGHRVAPEVLRALVAPLAPGRPLRRGWQVGAFDTVGGWPVVELRDAVGARVLRLQLATAGTFATAMARTARWDVVWLGPSPALLADPEVRRLLDAFTDLVRQNETG